MSNETIETVAHGAGEVPGCTALIPQALHVCAGMPVSETNRAKALRGEVVIISLGRLKEMQEQAIRFEGIGDGTYHWHWAAALNELLARRGGI